MGSLPDAQRYCLRWNNHRSNLLLALEELFRTKAFADVTLACDGESIKCHKVVLATCSPYFQHLLKTNDCRHPIVILSDIRFSEIMAILEYMYKGEVNVDQDKLARFLKVAETLKVKGLVVNDQSSSSFSTRSQSPFSNSNSVPLNIPHSSYHNNNYNFSFPIVMPWITQPYDLTSKSQYNSNEGPESNSSLSPLWSSQSSSSSGNSIMTTLPKPGVGTLNAVSSEYFKNETILVKSKKVLTSRKDAPILGGTFLDHASTCITPGNICNIAPVNATHHGLTPSSDSNTSPTSECFSDNSGSGRSDHIKKFYGDNHSFTMVGKEKGGGGRAIDVPFWNSGLKRYKQYTKSDIMAAIDAVKGGLSAFKAARKYGVPSRTLYDRVKKLNSPINRPKSEERFPMSVYTRLYMNSEDFTDCVSPEDQHLKVSESGNGMRHKMIGESSKLDSKSDLNMIDRSSSTIQGKTR